MRSNNILILGDSTSMSIGLEREMYPFYLADTDMWPDATNIINCSLPGFTSADAAAFFFRHQALWNDNLCAALIYLGNCDTASSEVKKGCFGYGQQFVNYVRESFDAMPKKVRLKNRLLHYQWDNTWDPTIESPENPNDFEFNIERIIKSCGGGNVPIILVRPKANRYFLPGVGKGNFLFYRFLNVKDRIADIIHIPDVRFKEALRLHELGNINEATKNYKEILLKPSSISMSQEYTFLVVNNYAVAQAEAGNVDVAKYLLNLLLKERGIRKEIILYNLAQLGKQSDDQSEYLDNLNDSYESDESLYRIRSPYLQAIDRVVSKYPSVRVVDMDAIVPDTLYLDHCHPLPEGQLKLASEIIRHLGEIGVCGSSKANIKNILYNPELSRGNYLSFHDYFKTASVLSEKEIAKAIEVISKHLKADHKFDSSSPAFASVPQEILHAMDYYLRHPCFPTIEDIMQSCPLYPTDVGRFPEYFLIRYLIPFLRIHELNPALTLRFSASLGLLHRSESFISILPEESIPFVDANPRLAEISYEEIRLPLILSKVRQLLIRHLRNKNQVFERTKSTIFWYVREALRFGAHSRHSMLYDRILMEFLAEGLAVAGVIDAAMGLKMAGEIEALINVLQNVVQVHEKYCAQFSLRGNTVQLLIAYDNKLKEISEQLEGMICTY